MLDSAQTKLREDAAEIIKSFTPSASLPSHVNAVRFVFLWRFLATMTMIGDKPISCCYQTLFYDAVEPFVKKTLRIETNKNIKDYAQYIM